MAEDNIEQQPEEQQADTAAETEEVKDKHGQPGINKERHDREMAEKDAKIAELTAKLDEAAKSEQVREELKSQMDKLTADIADERQTYALEKAGCIDVESAKAVIDRYSGNVSSLKEAKPWLFQSQTEKKGATGLPPAGTTKTEEEELAAARIAVGVRKR